MVFTTKYANILSDTISTEPSPESLQCHLESVWLKKVMRTEIKFH